MKIGISWSSAVARSVFCVSILFPVASLSASAPDAHAATNGEGAAILMGVAATASMQTLERQSVDRAALRQRLGYLIERKMTTSASFTQNDNISRIVRVVFDVGQDGRAVNVRVGKRSGDTFTDRGARQMIARFDRLPGGERYHVCTVLQYGRLGQDPNEPAFVKALSDARDAAIADLRAGRDGPDYIGHGHVIVD